VGGGAGVGAGAGEGVGVGGGGGVLLTPPPPPPPQAASVRLNAITDVVAASLAKRVECMNLSFKSQNADVTPNSAATRR
jgi:hypothetical protein